MDEEMLGLRFGVKKLVLRVDFLDRALPSSRRSLGSVNLEESRFPCVHPNCTGADIEYTRELRRKIETLKKEGEKQGTFTVKCGGGTKGTKGGLSCGGVVPSRVG